MVTRIQEVVAEVLQLKDKEYQVLQLGLEAQEQQQVLMELQQLTLAVEVVEDMVVPHLALILVILAQVALEGVEEEDMVVVVKLLLVEFQEQLILVVVLVHLLLLVHWVEMAVQV